MMRQSFITTSWDDGHPLDLRVAELLTKHGLRGTFYVPAASDRQTMAGGELRQLAQGFELGAHTLAHLVLTQMPTEGARREISQSKAWIEDKSGRPCRMFCPPCGRYGARHLDMVREAGYCGLRTVEMCSLDPPRLRAGVMVMPTSVQAHPHKFADFARNSLRRARFDNLWRYIVQGHAHDWQKLAEGLLRAVLDGGGVFHLWGHSWEVCESGQWPRLEQVLRLLGEAARDALPMTNAEICLLDEAAHATSDELSAPWTSS